MNKNIVEFYKDMLKTFGIEEENGKLTYKTATGKKVPINLEGLPIILPKKELIADIVEIVNGKPKLKARIFNPLAESVIKGENKSLTKLRKHIERMCEYSFIIVSDVLLRGVLYQEELKDYSPEFLKFIDMIQYKQPGVKKVVDDETLKKWESIADTGTERDKTFIHFFVKKGGKIGDVKYTRVGTITFPLYEELESMDVKRDLLLGKYKLRNKDKHVFQKLYEFIFELDKDELLDGFSIGTKNTTSPSFIVTMMMYDFVKNKINKAIEVAKSLNLDNETLDTALLPELPLPIEELEKFVDKVKYELLEIPSDHDLLIIDTQPQQEQPQQQTKSVFEEINKQPATTQPVNNNDSDELSPEEAMRLFGGGGAPYGGFPRNNEQPLVRGYNNAPAYNQPPSTGNPLLDGLAMAERKAYMEKSRSYGPPPSYGYGTGGGLNGRQDLPPRNAYANRNPYPNDPYARGYDYPPVDRYAPPRDRYGYPPPRDNYPSRDPYGYNPYPNDPYGLYRR